MCSSRGELQRRFSMLLPIQCSKSLTLSGIDVDVVGLFVSFLVGWISLDLACPVSVPNGANPSWGPCSSADQC